jgi:hypothetical protein
VTSRGIYDPKNPPINGKKKHLLCARDQKTRDFAPGPYGKGYPRGKKTAVRPFGGWPARRAYKGRA